MTDPEPDMSGLIKDFLTSQVALIALVERLGDHTGQVTQAVLHLSQLATASANGPPPAIGTHERHDQDDDDDRPVFDYGQRDIIEEYEQLSAALGRTDIPFYVSAEAASHYTDSGQDLYRVTVTGPAVASADTIRLLDGDHPVQASETSITFLVDWNVVDTPVRVLAKRRLIAVGTVRLVTTLELRAR